ncbi:MAG: CAP domain-containing protein [Kastovskya adunca ATA6-11-RM4]|jgi:uncharacterized protein YkwD|nr:CAP domain-containing protein [Kastovskya adunca ATA6-11-RM4]
MHKQLTKLVLGILMIAGGVTGYETLSSVNKDVTRPLSANAAPVTKATTSTSPSAIEQSVHAQINQYRQSRNLPPLSLNSTISQQARAHSQNMAAGRTAFSHDGFNQRVAVIGQTSPYRSAAENIAYNQGYSAPGKQAVEGWLKSTGHRKNIEGQFDSAGIGVAQNAKGEYYFTQIFIKRR